MVGLVSFQTFYTFSCVLIAYGNDSLSVVFCKHLQCKNSVDLDTIPILRQQRKWVSGVNKMAIFADVPYYSCVPNKRVGWGKKSKNSI